MQPWYLGVCALLFTLIGAFDVGAEEAGAEGAVDAEDEAGGESEAAVEQARALFEQGVAAFTEEEYEAALDAFQRSYDLNEVGSVLYNIAMCEMALFRHVEAIDSFQRYLEAGGERIAAERRSEVEEYVNELESRLGIVQLSVTPAGAVVSVDGVDVAPERWRRLLLQTGRHVIRASAAGHEDEVRQVDIVAREVTEIDLELTPVGAEDDQPPPPPPPPPVPVVRRWWFWTIIGVVVAGGAATGLAIGLTQGDDVGNGDWDVRLP